MVFISKLQAQILCGLSAFLLSLGAMAGISATAYISYSPPYAVPSLTPFSMAALAFLLAALVFRSMRNRGYANLPSMLLSLALISGLGWSTQAKFIDVAFAIVSGFVLDHPGGGIASVDVINNQNYAVTVPSGSPTQVINTISPPNSWTVGNPVNPCSVGQALVPSAVCYVQFLSPPG